MSTLTANTKMPAKRRRMPASSWEKPTDRTAVRPFTSALFVGTFASLGRRLGWVLGAFLALFLNLFFRGRVTLEAFGNLIQHFVPNAVIINDFLRHVLTPRQVFSLRINQIDYQRCVQGAFRSHQIVSVGPVVADILSELSPRSGRRRDNLGLAIGPIPDHQVWLILGLYFLQAALRQRLRYSRMDPVGDVIRIQLAELQHIRATDIRKSLVFREIQIGVKVDTHFRQGWRRQDQGK